MIGFQNTEDRKSEQGCPNRGDIVDVCYCHLCANQSLADQTKVERSFVPVVGNLNNKSNVISNLTKRQQDLFFVHIHVFVATSLIREVATMSSSV